MRSLNHWLAALRQSSWPVRAAVLGAVGMLAGGLPPVMAQPLADLAAIDRAVAGFAGAPAGMPGGAALPVDRRLRLSACPAPLALDWYGTERAAVAVVCPGAGGWRLYVPVVGGAGGAGGSGVAVQRGDAVTIAVRAAGFSVSQPAEALESGAVGSWVKVRGTGQAATVIRARVIRPGVVGIDLDSGSGLP